MKKLIFLVSLFSIGICAVAQTDATEIEKVMKMDEQLHNEMLQNDSTQSQSADTVSTTNEDEENYVLVVVEEMPQFPGGSDSMRLFIANNINKAAIQKTKYKGQRAIIEFVVEQNGVLSDVAVLRSSGIKLFDNEALRVVKMMPPWKPGLMSGEPVRTKLFIPIELN
jgi:protein TonB